jgi:hypothetical protein
VSTVNNVLSIEGKHEEEVSWNPKFKISDQYEAVINLRQWSSWGSDQPEAVIILRQWSTWGSDQPEISDQPEAVINPRSVINLRPDTETT